MDQKKVLIIDDEIDLCLLLRSYFHRNNYEVLLSHSLQDGLQKIKQEKPQIVFLDSNLPDGVGWDAAPGIAEKYPSIQLNLISAFHTQPPEMPDTAAVYIYEKPISFSDLDRNLQKSNSAYDSENE